MRYQHRRALRLGSGSSPDTADAEFAGQVDSVGPEPEFVSGRVIALQNVRLTVTDVRRGDLSAEDQIDLAVEIWGGNPHIGVGELGIPALDAAMVQPGTLLVAWANLTPSGWQAIEISTDGPSESSPNFAGRYRR